MPFQTQVQTYIAPAVEGDFADNNPRTSALAGPGGLVVGDPNGIIVGRFAWFNAAGQVTTQSANPAATDFGFVARRQTAQIVTYLAESGMNIPTGFGITLMTRGSYWGRFAAGATFKQKVYFAYADGSLSAAATASPATNTLTVNTASTTLITVTAVNAGNVLALGQPVSGAGIPAGSYITGNAASSGGTLTGAGGVGTYTISAAATATATGVAVTNTTNIETMFFVGQTCAAGELAKFSTGAV